MFPNCLPIMAAFSYLPSLISLFPLQMTGGVPAESKQFIRWWWWWLSSLLPCSWCWQSPSASTDGPCSSFECVFLSCCVHVYSSACRMCIFVACYIKGAVRWAELVKRYACWKMEGKLRVFYLLHKTFFWVNFIKILFHISKFGSMDDMEAAVV